jgi:hypothetical protein
MTIGRPTHGAIICNKDGEEFRHVQEGNRVFIPIRDEEQLTILHSIYSELKKMNFYLSQICDIRVSDGDAEDF